MTTPTVEAYLEIVYMMTVEGQPVIGARLAESLHVSRPTVTTTLKRMMRDGLVKIDNRKEIRLTSKGQAIAEHLQRRHRVVERWLTDVLGMDWARSDAEAHRIEHAMSDEITELLNEKMGAPATCPHGNPIPGNVPSVSARDRGAIQLSSAHQGDQVVVTRVSEYAENVAELLVYLEDCRLIPGARVTIEEIAPLEGPLTLNLGSRMVSLSRDVARFVWVRRVGEP